MKIFSLYFFYLGLLLLVLSCQKQENILTESERKKIEEESKITIKKVFEHSNNLEFLEGLNFYSDDTDAYYTNNGTTLSLKELKESYSQIGPQVESLKNSNDSWNSTVLSKDIVAFTLPIHLKIKLKGKPEYNGQLVWSGIVKKMNKKWIIVQSHESWLNCVEAASALTPNQ